MENQEEQRHPANAVFMLLEDRQFRFSVVKPGLEKERQRLGRLVTGKHQVRGFRNISKAPASLLLPVLAEEANVSPELARALLGHWMDDNSTLKEKVVTRLKELGYEPKDIPFDDMGNTSWQTMNPEHANSQFEGTFLPDEDDNAVMLMSLLLGWFGSDEEEETPEPEPQKEKETAAPSKQERKPEPKTAAKAKTSTKSKSDAGPARKEAKKSGTKETKAEPKKTTAKKTAAKKTGTKTEKTATPTAKKGKTAKSSSTTKAKAPASAGKKKAAPAKKDSAAAKKKTGKKSSGKK
jgi:hypothetical protein